MVNLMFEVWLPEIYRGEGCYWLFQQQKCIKDGVLVVWN